MLNLLKDWKDGSPKLCPFSVVINDSLGSVFWIYYIWRSWVKIKSVVLPEESHLLLFVFLLFHNVDAFNSGVTSVWNINLPGKRNCSRGWTERTRRVETKPYGTLGNHECWITVLKYDLLFTGTPCWQPDPEPALPGKNLHSPSYLFEIHHSCSHIQICSKTSIYKD